MVTAEPRLTRNNNPTNDFVRKNHEMICKIFQCLTGDVTYPVVGYRYMDDFDTFLEQQAHPPPPKLENQDTDNPCLVVPECDGSNELCSFVEELQKQWAAKPASLTLRFVGVHQMNSDPALLVYETLKHKPAATRVITDAWSPLLGGSVLVWLAGDFRKIRPTAWVYFHRSGRKKRRFPWDDEQEWDSAPEGPNLPEVDYRNLLRLIEHYLPVKDFAGKVVTPALLSEFCLLEERIPGFCRRPQGSPPAESSHPPADKPAGNIIWFIARNERGGYTLKGGCPVETLKNEPGLRQADIGLDFPTKEELLKHLNSLGLGPGSNAVVVDGEGIVKG